MKRSNFLKSLGAIIVAPKIIESMDFDKKENSVKMDIIPDITSDENLNKITTLGDLYKYYLEKNKIFSDNLQYIRQSSKYMLSFILTKKYTDHNIPKMVIELKQKPLIIKKKIRDATDFDFNKKIVESYNDQISLDYYTQLFESVTKYLISLCNSNNIVYISDLRLYQDHRDENTLDNICLLIYIAIHELKNDEYHLIHYNKMYDNDKEISTKKFNTKKEYGVKNV